METNRPEPAIPSAENEWLLASPELPATDGRSQRSARRGTVGVMAGLAAGAMILGGVIGGVVVSGVGSGDSPPAATQVAPSATLAGATQPPPPSMPRPDDDGDDDGEDDGEESGPRT